MASEARIWRARNWMPAYDKLPPELRKAMREAFYENHDPTEFLPFTLSRHNRIEPMIEQIKRVDEAKLADCPVEQVARGRGRPVDTESALDRALKGKRLPKPDPTSLRAAADRALEPPTSTAPCEESPSPEPTDASVLSRLRRMIGG